MQRSHLLFKGARIIDGSGGPSETADLAVEGSRILAIGDLSHVKADQVIAAQGLALAPGFIDVHAHDDMAVLRTPDMTPKISQGVTTVVGGNCGISLAPFTFPGKTLPAPFPLLGDKGDYAFPDMAAYRDRLGARPPALNIAMLTGHSSLRACVLGEDLERPARAEEIAAMKGLLHAALAQGSVGLSSGLDYPPALQAAPEEMIALGAVVKGFTNALYTTHMRDEGDLLLEAITETIETGKAAGVRAVISHLKCAGQKNYGKSKAALAAILAARGRQDLAFDVYPYIASSTSLIPRFIRDAESILVTYSDPYPEMAGRYLTEIAADWACTALQAAERLYPAGAVYFQMADADLEAFLAAPYGMIGSDGLPPLKPGSNPHPRLWGTFPRVLGHYAREKKLFDLETAVYKMTGLSAKTFNLAERGLLKEGFHADLVLFDPETIIDTATFQEPQQSARGIQGVYVAGKPVWQDGQATGARPGGFLPRAA